MVVLCGMPTIQYSARSAWLSVRLCKSACPKITSGQSNLPQGATCPSTMAHWRHLANTIELVHPSAHSSPQSKRQMDRFSRFCTAYGRKCLYHTMGIPIHQNCPFPWKVWTSHVTRDAFGPSPLPSNRHHRSNGDCLEGKRGKLSALFCAILCATIVHSAMHTHMNRRNSSLDWVLSHALGPFHCA